MTYKLLVIGDTHLKKWHPGYLESQTNALIRIIKESDPDIVVFLGDIFHDRHPDPHTLLAFKKVLDSVKDLTSIKIIRGNHDTSDKSNTETTVLDVFTDERYGPTVASKPTDLWLNGIYLHPHYENEDLIIKSIEESRLLNNREDSSYRINLHLGHFGFEGCIDTGQYHTFKVTKEHLDPLRKVVLGHIHRYGEYGNTIILGTPWPTNFGEGSYPHYVMELFGEQDLEFSRSWDNHKLKEIKFGPRFLTCRYESLDSIKEELQDPNYYTLLRVIVNKFDGVDGDSIKESILSTTKVNHVEIRFEPMLDKKLNNRISNYASSEPLEVISEDVILSYIEEQASTIPKESILAGLEDIKSHENQESKSQ